MNKKTGKITGKNCHGNEKVEVLRENENISKVDEVYSDSLSDLPLMNISKKAYIVKKNNISLL